MIQSAYARIIKQDIEWLEKNSEYSLEREHIKSVLEDSIEKFYSIIDEDKLDELAEEYYDSEIYQPSQAVFENGKLIKCADVDDNGEPYLSEWSIIQAYKAGYHKAKEE